MQRGRRPLEDRPCRHRDMVAAAGAGEEQPDRCHHRRPGVAARAGPEWRRWGTRTFIWRHCSRRDRDSSAQWWGAEELSSRAGLGGPSRALLRIRSTTLVSKWIHPQRAPAKIAHRAEAMISRPSRRAMNCRGTSAVLGNRPLQVGDAELQHTDRQAPHAIVRWDLLLHRSSS